MGLGRQPPGVTAMSILSDLYKGSLVLLTDLYQLTMAQGYWKLGRPDRPDREAVFHLFCRRAPATPKTCAPRSLVVLHVVPFSSHSDRPGGRNRPKTGPICAPQAQVADLAWRAQQHVAHLALAAQPIYSPHFPPQRPPLICRRWLTSQGCGPTYAVKRPAFPALRTARRTAACSGFS